MELTNQLQYSVLNDMENFSLVYQPFVSSDGLRLKGAEALLRRYKVDASHIVLEMTESYFVTDMPALKEAFQRLRDLNIRIAMDDFGTGYLSP